jgi:cell division protein FtsL
METHGMRGWLTLLAVAVIVVLAAGLYKAKTEAQKARARAADLVREVKEERAAVQALRAEIAHLESPPRVEALAKRNLELEIGGAGPPRRPQTEMGADLPPPPESQ